MKRIFLLSVFTLLAGQLYALNPSRTYKQLPSKYNMKYTEHKVTAADGAKLNAWYFAAKTGKTTKLVLISHNGEGNMADYLRRVSQFTEAGYNVVIYDYRGFGKSSNFEIDKNMYIYPHFQTDVAAMVDFCRKQFVQTFDMYGWGIGAGLSLGIGWNRTEIKSIIADTPFLSMEDLESRFENWDEPMEVPFAGYDKKHEPTNALNSVPKTLKNTSKRVFLMVGSNDILFKVADMKGLYTKQKKHVAKNIYVIENPDRKDNFTINKSAYFAQIKAFLGK